MYSLYGVVIASLYRVDLDAVKYNSWHSFNSCLFVGVRDKNDPARTNHAIETKKSPKICFLSILRTLNTLFRVKVDIRFAEPNKSLKHMAITLVQKCYWTQKKKIVRS